MSRLPAIPPPAAAAMALPAQAMDYAKIALAHESFEVATAAVASELACGFACEHVVVGVVSRGHAVKPVAWSGVGDLRGESRLVRAIGAAMNEAVDQHTTLCFPPNPHGRPCITLMHAELTSAGICGASLTIPLVARGQIVGAMTLLRDKAAMWSEADIEALEGIAGVLGPILDLKQRSESSAMSRLRGDVADVTRKLRVRGYAGTKLAVLCGIGILIALATVPVTVNVSAQARLEGIVQRSVAAPADSYVKEVFVRAGDEVKQGQLLLTLADEDLRAEQRRLQSELARYTSEHAEAFALQDRGQMVIAQSRADEIAAALAVVDQQLERTQVLAPFGGVIIKGDLQQQVGAPVKRGEVLLVLSPSSDHRIILEVADVDIDKIKAGMGGRLTLSALPYESLGIRVNRVTPIAHVSDGENVFEVQARLMKPVKGLRPGLEGIAKLPVGKQALLLSVGTRVSEWLRFQLWSWLG